MEQGNRLLVRLPNWVGDVVIALPVLDALENAGFELTLVGRPFCDDLLAAYPTTRLSVSRRHLSAAKRIRTLGSKNALLFVRSFGSALEMRLAGVRPVGYRAEGRSLLLAKALKPIWEGHIIEYYWRLGLLACTAFGGDESAFAGTPPVPRLTIGAEHRMQAGDALKAAGVTGQFQIWCPMASNTIHGHSKIWPHFKELADRISESGISVVSCPGPGQEDAVAEALPSATVVPGLGLGAMAGAMQQSSFVLANDTGPMHVAAGVHTPVLGLFGPGSQPERTGPIGGATLGGPQGWPEVAEVLQVVTNA